MIYPLDTNTCIRHLNQRSSSVTERLRELPENEIALCSVVRAELYYGAMKSRHPEQTLLKQRAFVDRFHSFPFDDDAALVYGRIRAELERVGQTIGANDLMIAAIALLHNLTLVTHNVREFERIPALTVEDWQGED
ncbi:MAG: VapC toxin family PIN domain ribonuclease [Phototrophicales bacterium]|nr:MAG: VapC toxin family PIN domain ribonuclease [Phototrophicales bacterium]